jgi:hypothetical protein
MRSVAIVTAVLAVGLWSAAAAAEDTTAAPKKKGAIVLPETKLLVKRPVPLQVDVARVIPRAPLPDLRQPLVDRIGNVVENAPF